MVKSNPTTPSTGPTWQAISEHKNQPQEQTISIKALGKRPATVDKYSEKRKKKQKEADGYSFPLSKSSLKSLISKRRAEKQGRPVQTPAQLSL